MFYGEYEHTLDKKGRVIVPSKFREIFKEHYAEKFYITRGLDQCLFVFAEDEWRAQERKFKDMSFTKPQARRFNRLYFSGACEVTCDKQGRILIPQYLKEYGEIKADVVIVGVANRIEIWSKERWKAYFKESAESYEDLAERLVDLDKGGD